MKKTILLVPFLAVGVAFATGENSGTTVEGQNAIGVLEVAASSKPTTVLLSVPFTGYGDGNDLKASELVAKETLLENTILRVAVPSVGGYYSWKLTSQKWQPVNPIVIERDGEGEITTPEADTVSVGRGNSFWLELPSSLGGGDKITLIGQQDTSEKGSISLSGKKWNLVGNPNVEGFNVAGKIANPDSGDYISVQNGATGKLKTYFYNGSQWIYNRQAFDSVTLNPGDGCWIYVQTGTVLNF